MCQAGRTSSRQARSTGIIDRLLIGWIFNPPSTFFYTDGKMAFLGYKSGTLTASEKSALLAYSQTHYGTP